MSRLDRVKRAIGGTISMSPIDIELQGYLDLMYGPCDADVSEDEAAPMNSDVKDPLEFWSNHSASFKILFRMVRRVFPISPCSTDIERFFSTTGFICADHRGRFLPNTINMLASLNSWLRTKYGYNRSRRQQKSADTCQRFTSINLALQLIPGVELENDDDSEEEDDDL
jgi:hypothetical protein